MTSRGKGRSRSGPDFAREHHVTLRRQLAATLEAAIRDGHLGPGSYLPSTRDMANRLGLHRSTVNAAYARLRRRGCVVGGVGHRMRVVSRGAALRHTAVDGWADAGGKIRRPVPATPDRLVAAGIGHLLGQAVRLGVSREAALDELVGTATRVAERARANRLRVTLFEPRPGLRTVLAAELSRRLALRVEPTGHPGRTGAVGTPLLVRSDLEEWVEQRRPDSPDTIPLHIAGGTRERGFVRRVARGGLVTLVTVSRTVRHYARDLAAREFGRGISFAALDPSDTRALYRSAGASRLVLFDEPSRDRIPSLKAPAVSIQLLTDAQMLALGAYLDAPGRGRPDRRSTIHRGPSTIP